MIFECFNLCFQAVKYQGRIIHQSIMRAYLEGHLNVRSAWISGWDVLRMFNGRCWTGMIAFSLKQDDTKDARCCTSEQPKADSLPTWMPNGLEENFTDLSYDAEKERFRLTGSFPGEGC